MKFGIKEVIRPFDTAKLHATKEAFNFGTSKGVVTQDSESIRVNSATGAIDEFVSALVPVKNGEMQYLAFEVYTDEAGKIFRVNKSLMTYIPHTD